MAPEDSQRSLAKASRAVEARKRVTLATTPWVTFRDGSHGRTVVAHHRFSPCLVAELPVPRQVLRDLLLQGGLGNHWGSLAGHLFQHAAALHASVHAFVRRRLPLGDTILLRYSFPDRRACPFSTLCPPRSRVSCALVWRPIPSSTRATVPECPWAGAQSAASRSSTCTRRSAWAA